MFESVTNTNSLQMLTIYYPGNNQKLSFSIMLYQKNNYVTILSEILYSNLHTVVYVNDRFVVTMLIFFQWSEGNDQKLIFPLKLTFIIP